MELNELIHFIKNGAEIIVLLFLIPLGIYLRQQTYRNVDGNATIWRGIKSLLRSVKEWAGRRKTINRSKYNK